MGLDSISLCFRFQDPARERPQQAPEKAFTLAADRLLAIDVTEYTPSFGRALVFYRTNPIAHRDKMSSPDQKIKSLMLSDESLQTVLGFAPGQVKAAAAGPDVEDEFV